MRAGVICVALFLSITAANAAQPAKTDNPDKTDKAPIGYWYEEAHYGGQRVLELLHIKPDGTFSSHHRICIPHHPEEDDNSGYWSYESGKMRLTTTRIDGLPTYSADNYLTESYDGQIWAYRAIGGDAYKIYGPVRFRDVRVTADSKLPACDLTS